MVEQAAETVLLQVADVVLVQNACSCASLSYIWVP